MRKSIVMVLRVLLGFFLLVSVLAQFFAIPGLIGDVRAWAPEFAHLALPYGGSAFLAFICVEVVLVAMWVLLGLAREGTVFSEKAFRWVNIIIWATWIAVALALVPVGYMIIGPSETSGSPGAFLLMIVVTLGGAAFALLMTVMRALLRQATDARAELEEVI